MERSPASMSDLTGAVYLPFPSSSRIEYSVLSRSNPVLPADLSSKPSRYPESFTRHFLQTPLQSERITVLAEDMTQTQRTAYDKANAIQSFLIQNFRYSLDATLAELDHPLEEFLFSRKTGYCEHYATAMVIMLRTIGIPARLVTGFLATEWNEYGNYYVVRQQDAHAWVEVHLPHSGWITMDPTPPSIQSLSSGSPAWHALGRMMDTIRLQWSRFFVQYSAADQLAVVRELKAGGTSARHKAFDSIGALFTPFVAMFGGMTEYASKGTMQFAVEVLAISLIGLAVLWLGIKRPWVKGSVSKKTTRDEQVTWCNFMDEWSNISLGKALRNRPPQDPQFVRIAQAKGSRRELRGRLDHRILSPSSIWTNPPTSDELTIAEDHLRRLMALNKP